MSNTNEKTTAGRILLHVSGSISCYKAAELASLLVSRSYEVQVTASPGALRFIEAATFEGLTHRPLLTDIFGGKPDYIPHITLAQNWADVIIAYPASADCINRLAAGLCDDLFGAVCLANNYVKPLLVAPAMNSMMFAHPAVQDSLRKLASWGTILLPADEGRLACGTVGPGKLISPERAAAFIAHAFGRSEL
jgi:phosphopantothenoylcysteine decarboxylase